VIDLFALCQLLKPLVDPATLKEKHHIVIVILYVAFSVVRVCPLLDGRGEFPLVNVTVRNYRLLEL